MIIQTTQKDCFIERCFVRSGENHRIKMVNVSLKIIVIVLFAVNTLYCQVPSSGVDVLDHVKSFKFKKINEYSFQGTNKSDKNEKCIIVYNDDKIKTLFLFNEHGTIYYYENLNYSEIRVFVKHEKLNVLLIENKSDTTFRTIQTCPK